MGKGGVRKKGSFSHSLKRNWVKPKKMKKKIHAHTHIFLSRKCEPRQPHATVPVTVVANVTSSMRVKP